MVRQVRLRHQRNNRDRFVAAVERIAGQRVVNHESQVLFGPDYTVEMFVMDDDGTPPVAE